MKFKVIAKFYIALSSLLFVYAHAQSGMTLGETICHSYLYSYNKCVNNIEDMGSTGYCKKLTQMWSQSNCSVVMQGATSILEFDVRFAYEHCMADGTGSSWAAYHNKLIPSGDTRATAAEYCQAVANGVKNDLNPNNAFEPN